MATRKITRVVVTYDDGTTRELPALWIEKGWLTKPTLSAVTVTRLEAAKVSARNRTNAQHGRKLTDRSPARMFDIYRRCVEADPELGPTAITVLAIEYGVTERHVRRILKQQAAA